MAEHTRKVLWGSEDNTHRQPISAGNAYRCWTKAMPTSEKTPSNTTSLTTGERQKSPSSSGSWKAKADLRARFCRFSTPTQV